MNFPEVRAMGGSMGAMGIGAPGLTTHTPTPTPTPTDSGIPPVPPPMPSPPEATPYMGFQSTPSLSSPPAVSHPSIASMWGIGGFTTPPMPPPPPVVCPNTIASTLGIPQMPNVTYFNSRAPMGFNFRMAASLNGIPYAFKRKPEEEPEEIKPLAKQHISEERMTAHLNSLHLSDSYCNHRLGKGKPYRSRTLNTQVVVDDDDDDDDEEEEDEGLGGDGTMALDSSDLHGATRLVIADEVKKIVPGEAKLPDSLLKKLTKPSMEVVLWQPPTTILRNMITPNIDAKIKASQNATAAADPPTSTSISASSPSITNTSPSSASSSSLPSLASTSSSSSSATSSSSTSSSSSSSPDSGISISSPPPTLSFLGRNSVTASPSFSISSSASTPPGAVGASSELGLDLLSLPSTSSGSRGSGFPPPPLRRPASPLPDPMVEDDFSERMEFNNNNGNAPNFMWLEENNNTALLDLNAVEPQRAAAAAAAPVAPTRQPPLPEDLPDFPDDDMDL